MSTFVVGTSLVYKPTPPPSLGLYFLSSFISPIMSLAVSPRSHTSAPSFPCLLNNKPKVSREDSSPFGAMKLQRQQEPHWVWRFKRRQEKLLLIIMSLARSKTDSITDKKAKHCRIQLNPLNFQTGETSPSVTPYFTPTEDEVLVRQPACVLMKSQFIRRSLRGPTSSTSKSSSQSQSKYDRLLRKTLSEELERYRLAATYRRRIPGLKSFPFVMRALILSSNTTTRKCLSFSPES